MKLKKKKIVIMDMGLLGLNSLKIVHSQFPLEDIIYINDERNIDYDKVLAVDRQKEIDKKINLSIKKALNADPKIIIVVSDTLYENGKHLFDELNVPVIFLIDEIISYVNENYEYKNMAFIARKSTIEANLYPKDIRYSHLYYASIDNSLESFNNLFSKTAASFADVLEIKTQIYKKIFDVIILTEVNLVCFYTEFKEYFPDSELIDIEKIFFNMISTSFEENKIEFETSKKGKQYLNIRLQNKYSKKYDTLAILNHFLEKKYIIQRD